MKEDMKKELDNLLKEAEKVENVDNFEQLPDGDYIGIIDKVGFGISKAKNLKFTWEVKILEGDYANRREWKHQALTSPENFKRLTTDLEKFGVNTSSMTSIENDLDNLLDVKVHIEIKTNQPKDSTKNPFRNISIKPCDS